MDYRNSDKNHIWHPYTKYSAAKASRFPIIDRADGVWLIDDKGDRYLDAISSWWCCNLGHTHRELVETIREQAGRLQHSILGNLTHFSVIELSERLCSLFEDSDRRVFYGSDGASAVEAALKISVQYWYNRGKPQKHRFASLSGAYHGDTLGAVGVGFMKGFHKQFEQVVIPSLQADAPCCATCAWGKKESTCGTECFESMEKIVTNHADELAAVIVEPLCQGAGGMRIYSPKYLKKLHYICIKNEVLLIVDEIAVGYGRTGKMFAFEHADIDPDIICVGKGITGGYLPLSATIVKNTLYHTFTDKIEDNTLYHGHTFAGNPIGTAVACTVLDIYERDNIVDVVKDKGDFIAQRMKRFLTLDAVDNIRNIGMINAVELTTSQKALQVSASMMKKGYCLRPLGPVLYFMLPFITEKNLIEEIIDEFYDSIMKL